MVFRGLALIAVIIGFIVAIVDPKTEFVMAVQEWFIMAIALALIAGLEAVVPKRGQ